MKKGLSRIADNISTYVVNILIWFFCFRAFAIMVLNKPSIPELDYVGVLVTAVLLLIIGVSKGIKIMKQNTLYKRIKIYFRDFKQGIKNLIRYFKIIWKDRDWDFGYTVKLLRFKLQNQSKYFEGDNYRSDSDYQVSRLKLADKLLSIYTLEPGSLSEQYYDAEKQEVEDAGYGYKFEFVEIPNTKHKEGGPYYELERAFYQDLNEDEKDKAAQFISEVRKKYRNKEEKAKKLAWKLINQHLENWWD